jgi:hypothetical protein
MTEVNGFRLAYRGLVAGLAAGWVWIAIAAAGLMLAGADPLGATRAVAGGTPGSGLIGALALTQGAAGGIGLVFAYFFGRYFTVRGTLELAAPAFAVLSWLAVSRLLGTDGSAWTAQLALLAAALGYGAMLGCAMPIRGDVLR